MSRNRGTCRSTYWLEYLERIVMERIQKAILEKNRKIQAWAGATKHRKTTKIGERQYLEA